MPVVATCSECGDKHDLGDRKRVPGTTACPSCGSTSYGSTPVETSDVKPEADRIRDAIKDVSGVGDETVDLIVERYGLYAELESASVDELTEIKNVGETVAKRIQDATKSK